VCFRPAVGLVARGERGRSPGNVSCRKHVMVACALVGAGAFRPWSSGCDELPPAGRRLPSSLAHTRRCSCDDVSSFSHALSRPQRCWDAEFGPN
jgi:hypothetical protein